MAPHTYMQISAHELIIDRWYLGRGRNSNIGQWSGKHFLVISRKGIDLETGEDHLVVKKEPYYAEESGCFQPFVLLDEGTITTPFGKSGWDAHYGSELQW